MKEIPFSRFKRVLKIMILTLLTLGIIGTVLFEEYAMPYMPISPIRRVGQGSPMQYGLHYDTLNVPVDTNLTLRGYFIYANTAKPKATILLLHGIGGYKEGRLSFAKYLSDKGFHIILYDQRAHGKSGGQYCTFGHYEKHDAIKFIDIAQARFPHLPIGIHGASMGGAVALQTLALDKRLQFGIVESTFHSLEDVVIEYGYDYFKFRSRWLAQRVLSKSAIIAQYNPFEVKPIEAASQIDQPMLLIHGEKDDRIPIEFNKRNYEALKSQDKEFYTVVGAKHNNVGDKGGQAYLDKMITFLNRQIRQNE